VEDVPVYLSLGLLYRIEQIAGNASEAGRIGAEVDWGR
jgi:hypothetical protein